MWKAIKAHAEVFFSLCKVYIILITISTFLKFFVLLNTIAKNTEKKLEKKTRNKYSKCLQGLLAMSRTSQLRASLGT